MGVVKRQAGEITEAMELFNNASATGEIAAYNTGLINIRERRIQQCNFKHG